MAGNDRILIFGAGYVTWKFADHFSALKNKPACLITKADIADPVQVDKSISGSSRLLLSTVLARPAVRTSIGARMARSTAQRASLGLTRTGSARLGGPTCWLTDIERCQESWVFLAPSVPAASTREVLTKKRFRAEDDEPNFFGSFYSRTKDSLRKSLSMMSEKDGAKVLQLRLRMPLDSCQVQGTSSPRSRATSLGYLDPRIAST